jgi:hypothetical protein
MKTGISSVQLMIKCLSNKKEEPMIRKMCQKFISLIGSIYNRLKRIFPSRNNTLMSVKQSAMKSNNIQQEILVFTQTSFVQKVLIENTGIINKNDPVEELENACWNGMLYKMLPELMPRKQRRRLEISIWQICTSEYSLFIDMAEGQDLVQNSGSISPFQFLSTSRMN